MSAPVIQTEMGGLSVRFFRAGLPQSSVADGTSGTSGTSGTTLHPYNLTSSDGTSGTSGTTYDTLIKEILNFCSEDWHTIEQIAETVQRSKRHIRGRIIPLIKERLEMKYPNNPNHPNQQYRTKR
jgi:hypothetical protein